MDSCPIPGQSHYFARSGTRPGPVRDRGKKSGSVPDISGRLATISLASHTLQSQEKEGLVTSRAQSCTRSRILEQPITFEILKCAVLPVATRRVMRRRFITRLRMNVARRKRKMVLCRWPSCRKEPDDVDRG